MANTKTSDESAAAALTGTELVRIVQSAASVRSTTADVARAVIDTDGTLAANSDLKHASQKATKTYADTKLAKAGGTLSGALNEAPTVTIASSTTPAIGAAAGNSILLTGTTTVTGFDTIAAGTMRRVRFGGILTLTYNATSLILPTSASITTAADDVAEFLSLGSGNWICTSYTRKSGAALVGSAVTTTKGDLSGYSTLSARVPVGANYTHLMADSTATLGVKWALDKEVPLGYFGTLANDGTTDDAAVFATAIASGVKYINARGLNVAILTQVSLAAGVVLDISGSTITTTGSTLTTFKADTIDDWALIGEGATIIGAGTTVGTAKGLHVVGCKRFRVSGLRIKNIKGHGFYLAPGTPSGSIRGDGGVYTNCFAEACYWGWEDTNAASGGNEYTLVSNFRATGCTTWGAKTCAGNIVWTGGNLSDNVGDGMVMAGGTNHAHGMCVGLNINHNGTNNLNLSGVVNGQSFVGCHFYEKIILLDGCKGVTFTGGVIDTPTITVNSGTGSGACLIKGVYFPGGYGAPGAIGGTDTPSLILKDCFGAGNIGNTDLRTRSASTATSYTLDDECLLHPSADTTARTFTIPANASVPFPIGKVLSGINQHSAGVITLAITTDTMRWLGNSGTTGSRTIAADGSWAAQKISATEWAVTGVGMT